MQAVLFSDSPEIVTALILSGANPNFVYGPGIPLLVQSIVNGVRPEIIRALIEAGADVNRPTKEGKTPLMAAAALSTPETVRLLLEKGARVNTPDEEGRTALFFAVGNKKHGSEIISVLAAAGADVSVEESHGFTAYMLALVLGRLKTAEALWNVEGNLSRELQSEGVTTLMFTAASTLDPGVLSDLAFPRSLEERSKTDGWTPLMFAAASNENYMAAQTLIDAGADVNARDNNGNTVLMNAAKNSKEPNVLLILLSAGASLYARNTAGKTAFDYAAQNQNPALLQMLNDYRDGKY